MWSRTRRTDMEHWLPIPGWEGLYEASDLGRIKSLSRRCRSKDGFRTLKERILKQTIEPDGYVIVTLHRDGKQKAFRSHRLTLLTFEGPCPEGMESLHRDGIRSNNRLSNLRWGTRPENREDRQQPGDRKSDG